MRIVALDTFPLELDAVADASPRATFYHTSVWLSSLAESYPKLQLRCLVAEDDGKPAAYLPYCTVRRGPFASVWSLPFGTYGGPVGAAPALAPLLAAFRALGEQRGVIEVGWVDYYRQFEAPAGATQATTNHVVDIAPGFDAVWRERFDKPRRRRARRAEELGVSVRRGSGMDDVARFYAVYRSRLAAWEERAGHPEALFRGLVVHGGSRVRLYLAEHQGEVVGGHVNFYYKDDVTAWYGMASRHGDELHAGTLLYATGMREACEDGYRTYNLGASLGKSSLEEYKRSLGGEPHTYSVVCTRRLVGRIAARLRGVRR